MPLLRTVILGSLFLAAILLAVMVLSRFRPSAAAQDTATTAADRLQQRFPASLREPTSSRRRQPRSFATLLPMPD